MKNLIVLIMCVLMAFYFVGCHEIDVPVTTEITPALFPKDSLQFNSALGGPYAALRGNFSLDYWFMQSLSTDEAILPARGSDWYDGQNYMNLHYHDWTRDHPWTGSCWTWISRVIGTTNQTMSLLKTAEPDGFSQKKIHIAELKMVRAIAYFMMMDLYGNVPIDTTYSDGDYSQMPTTPRQQVFNFIESEIKSALPNLNSEVSKVTYGRATKYLAYALLAKMYLNAEVYTGVARYDDCIAACDNVISSAKYSIEGRSTYLGMFYPTNGPSMKEFIFAIPYDMLFAALPNTNGMMYHARYDVPPSLQAKFGLTFKPSGPESTLPEFYAYFNDSTDVRNGQWLTGPQYLSDGVTPAKYTTTKQGYDYTYSGADAKASYTYHVVITPDIILRGGVSTFNVGKDEIGWNMGYRNIKFYPDASSLGSRNQNNDVPFLRYSDIILMKAEAIFRGGATTSGDTPLTLINLLRSNRTTSAALSSVTLDDIYAERCREFAWETWHRNDMIRFGKYEDSWGFKTNTDTYRRIFPIPTIALTLNKSLTQNPGY